MKLTIQIFIFVSIFFCGSTKAQNFLYNPNFEIVGDSLPAGHGHWFACDGAYNLNGEHFLPYGTPDYYHYYRLDSYFDTIDLVWVWQKVKWVPNYGPAVVVPKKDSAMMGFGTYGNFAPSYREYIQMPLLYPLVPGTKYRISLWLTNGQSNISYQHSTDGIGLLFSTDSLHQDTSYTLDKTPQAEIQGEVWEIGWKQYHLSFIADSAYEYVTIGNFYTDAQTSITKQSNLGVLNASYYFIDDIGIYPDSSIALFAAPKHSICQGDSVELLAYNDTLFRWAEASNPTQIISNTNSVFVMPTVNTSYFVYGSKDTLSVLVKVIEKPIADMGGDTAFCSGFSFYFEPKTDTAVYSYRWDNGLTTKGKQIQVPGLHWVDISRQGCTVRHYKRVHEVVCTYYTCLGDSLLLKGVPNETIAWAEITAPNTILSTNQDFAIIPQVTATFLLYTNLDTFTVQVSVIEKPSVSLMLDTVICFGDSFWTTAFVDSAEVIGWSTGDSSLALYVDTGGMYVFTAWKNGCSARDTLNIYELQCSYTICEGEMLNLTGYSSNGSWAHQSKPDSIIAAGLVHSITPSQSTSFFYYSDLDTHLIDVIILSRPVINVGKDTLLCEGDEFWIELQNTLGTIVWNNQIQNNSYLVTGPGIYWADITVDGCAARDSIQVFSEDCSVKLEMPNVFTPNGDGSNDYFKPFNLDNVVNFELLIYNRWGNLIYEGVNLEGWDGKFNGSEVSDGVYFWIANYSGIDNQNQVLKGDVTLIR